MSSVPQNNLEKFVTGFEQRGLCFVRVFFEAESELLKSEKPAITYPSQMYTTNLIIKIIIIVSSVSENYLKKKFVSEFEQRGLCIVRHSL